MEAAAARGWPAASSMLLPTPGSPASTTGRGSAQASCSNVRSRPHMHPEDICLGWLTVRPSSGPARRNAAVARRGAQPGRHGRQLGGALNGSASGSPRVRCGSVAGRSVSRLGSGQIRADAPNARLRDAPCQVSRTRRGTGPRPDRAWPNRSDSPGPTISDWSDGAGNTTVTPQLLLRPSTPPDRAARTCPICPFNTFLVSDLDWPFSHPGSMVVSSSTPMHHQMIMVSSARCGPWRRGA
jgi:hypothetical protein